MTVAFFAAGMSPAAAAGGDTLYVAGGQGYATWDWGANPANLDNVRIVAWDTDCNANGVYTYISVTNMLGFTRDSEHTNDACNEIGSERWSFWQDVANIAGVRVTVCEDVDGQDPCSSQYYDNPNT